MLRMQQLVVISISLAASYKPTLASSCVSHTPVLHGCEWSPVGKHNSESIQMTHKAIFTVVRRESKRTTLRGGVVHMRPLHLWGTELTLLNPTKLLLCVQRNQSNSDHARSAGKAVTHKHSNTECDVCNTQTMWGTDWSHYKISLKRQ